MLIAIVDTNVLSVDGASMLPNRSVLIENGTISKISHDEIDTTNVRVIDGTGKYLISGLVESHGHLQNSPNDLLVYVAHGVTYLREMGGKERHIEWRDEIAEGRLGPKLNITRVLASYSGLTGICTELFGDKINYTEDSAFRSIV